MLLKKGGNIVHMLKENSKASISIKRIIAILLILSFLMGIGVMAANTKLNSVTIILANGYEMEIVTSKTNIKEILEENHIILQEDEEVVPKMEEELTANTTIRIKNKEEVVVAENQEEEITVETLLQDYASITEKIVTVQEEIPFETVTKDVASASGTKQEKVIQEGQNGIKEVTYKIKYQGETEIEKKEIASNIIKEPVNKIIEVRTKQVTSRGGGNVRVTGSKAEYQAYAKAKCQDYGWSEYDFECLVSLWNRESGWNPSAHNASSGAHGIAQALPASKMASCGSDYMTNYKTQINWGLSYIKSRYGTPANAWGHSQLKGWY